MKRRHFIPETSVMMDRVVNEIMFDIRPYTVVILKPVLIELDGLKNDEGEKGKIARAAINALEKVQIGEVHLRSFEEYYDEVSPFLNQELPFAHLVFSDKRVKVSVRSFDDEIILLAEEYAQKNKDADVVLLTNDTAMRIEARNLAPSITVISPREWFEDVIGDAYTHEQNVLEYSQTDDELKEAHIKRKKIRDGFAALPDSEIPDDMKSELAKAESLEKEELARVIQAEEKRKEKRQRRIEARQQDERKELEAQEQAAREAREALELEERRRGDKRRGMLVLAFIFGPAILCTIIGWVLTSALGSSTGSSGGSEGITYGCDRSYVVDWFESTETRVVELDLDLNTYNEISDKPDADFDAEFRYTLNLPSLALRAENRYKEQDDEITPECLRTLQKITVNYFYYDWMKYRGIYNGNDDQVLENIEIFEEEGEKMLDEMERFRKDNPSLFD